MSAASRARGAVGEEQLAATLRAAGFDARRTANAGGLADVHVAGIPVHFEAKFAERIAIWEALAQAARDARPGHIPVVAFRRNRCDWHAGLPLEALLRLLAHRYPEAVTEPPPERPKLFTPPAVGAYGPEPVIGKWSDYA